MEENRITSNRIEELKPGEIFVFGSNLEGAHGGGAAWLAHRNGVLYGDKALDYKDRRMESLRCMADRKKFVLM